MACSTRPGTIGVDHQLDAWSHRLARDRDLGRADLVQLHAGVAALHRFGGMAFDQVEPSRSAAGLRRPACARRSRRCPSRRYSGWLAILPAMSQSAMSSADSAKLSGPLRPPLCCLRAMSVVSAAMSLGIAADRERRDHVLDRVAGGAADREAEALAPAGDALVGRHLDQQRLHVAPRNGVGLLQRAAVGVGHADVERFDAGDLHGDVRLHRDVNVVAAADDLVGLQAQPPVGGAFAGLDVVFVAVPGADEIDPVLREFLALTRSCPRRSRPRPDA